MLFTLQDVQEKFDSVEVQFQEEVHESETAPEAQNGGYKEMLRAYVNINDVAFEVLYDDQLEEYHNDPKSFHLYGDDSRVDWGEILTELEKFQ